MFAIIVILGILSFFVSIPGWLFAIPIGYILIVGFGWALIAMFWSSFGGS
jgi:hypothetical protein